MTFWLLEPVNVYRHIDYITLFRTILSMGIVFMFVYILKDKQALTIGGISFVVGIGFEILAHVIGIRNYIPGDWIHFAMIMPVLALEIAGATAMVWCISSLIYKKPQGWKVKVGVWGGIVLCITIIFPLIVGS
jgi:hypothetical protein